MTANRTALSRQSEGRLAHWGLAVANWTERWFPDPFVFALLGVAVVFLIGMAVGETPANLAIQAGKSFWSLVSSLISWGLSLVFSGLFVKELVRHVKGLDYRAAGAAGFLGIGTVWALGLSSSAAPDAGADCAGAASPLVCAKAAGTTPTDSSALSAIGE